MFKFIDIILLLANNNIDKHEVYNIFMSNRGKATIQRKLNFHPRSQNLPNVRYWLFLIRKFDLKSPTKACSNFEYTALIGKKWVYI